MSRLTQEPSSEDVMRWRKGVEDIRKELFNKPCKKRYSRSMSRYVSRDLEEDAMRQMLDEAFGIPTQRAEVT
jgi:hypothetical protein